MKFPFDMPLQHQIGWAYYVRYFKLCDGFIVGVFDKYVLGEWKRVELKYYTPR